jgi:hypothetical protein
MSSRFTVSLLFVLAAVCAGLRILDAKRPAALVLAASAFSHPDAALATRPIDRVSDEPRMRNQRDADAPR